MAKVLINLVELDNDAGFRLFTEGKQPENFRTLSGATAATEKALNEISAQASRAAFTSHAEEVRKEVGTDEIHHDQTGFGR